MATVQVADALLRSISHKLRTPLTSIQGALSYLQQDEALQAAAYRNDRTRQNGIAPSKPVADHDEEIRRELIENAVAEAERLNRFIGNLLDMARIESGVIQLAPAPCNVEDLIGVALDSVDRSEAYRVRVRVTPGLPLVAMDFTWMLKVLIHVLDNALRYSHAGTPILVRAAISGENLEIVIADRGVGIPAGDLTQVFDKFYRAGRGEEATGTGLGLAISKGILTAHGGSICAMRRKGGGTAVTVMLPRDRAVAQSC